MNSSIGNINTMSVENATNIAVDLSVIYLPWIIAVITGAGVSVSFITFVFERRKFRVTSDAEEKRFDLASKAEDKKFRLASTVEAFRLLNDVKHREARKVVYNIGPDWTPNESSFKIIGIDSVTSNGESNQKALEDVCKEIVKNDLNEIGTLIHHKLLDGDIFIEEGFWVILKTWSLLKDEIEDRRKKDSIHHMKHLEDLRMKACNYTKEHDTKVYEKFCRDEANTPK